MKETAERTDSGHPPLSVDRWKISGVLRALSPLRIATGDHEDTTSADGAEIWAIDEDVLGAPFIPGSALKGCVRAIAAEILKDDDRAAVFSLFGDYPRVRGSSKDTKTAIAGRAEFRNAFLDGSAAETVIGARTKIDRGTGAAVEGLRNQRVVAPGAAFRVTIIVDRAGEKEAGLLCGLLDRLDDSALGSGKSAGFGRVAWETEDVRRLDASAIAEWLKRPGDDPWKFARREKKRLAKPSLQATRGTITINAAIEIDGFFLVASAARKDKASDKGSPDQLPLRRSRADDRAYLPGSSLKGRLRAQAERIWRTMADDAQIWSEDRTPEPIAALFGSPDAVGLLTVEDFIGEGRSSKQTIHHMVAIDRFVGGVAGGGKFALQAHESPRLKGRLTLVPMRAPNNELSGKIDSERPASRLTRDAFGLLALTLRDLAEGDAPLGYGSRKGYGAVVNVTLEGEPVYAALENVAILLFGETVSVAQCIEALEKFIGATRSVPQPARSLEQSATP